MAAPAPATHLVRTPGWARTWPTRPTRTRASSPSCTTWTSSPVSGDTTTQPEPKPVSEPSSLFVVCSDESVNVGLFSIFRGFGGGGNRITGELDELHAGFTRDGFHWFRQLPRRALMPFSWPGEHDRMHTIFLARLRSSHRSIALCCRVHPAPERRAVDRERHAGDGGRDQDLCVLKIGPPLRWVEAQPGRQSYCRRRDAAQRRLRKTLTLSRCTR